MTHIWVAVSPLRELGSFTEQPPGMLAFFRRASWVKCRLILGHISSFSFIIFYLNFRSFFWRVVGLLLAWCLGSCFWPCFGDRMVLAPGPPVRPRSCLPGPKCSFILTSGSFTFNPAFVKKLNGGIFISMFTFFLILIWSSFSLKLKLEIS